MIRSDITAARATTHTDRQRALTVLDASYTEEKHWVESAAKLFPEDDLRDERITWVVATVGDSPTGVLRVDFDPPLDHYRDYDLLDSAGDLDIDAFVQRHRIAQIGPFAIHPAFRCRFQVVF